MALRLPTQQCLRASSSVPTLSITRLFSTSPPAYTQRAPQPKRARRDQYAREQAKARKAANISRRDAIHAERAKAMGDPIRGESTAFVESFDDPPTEVKDDSLGSSLNFFVRGADLNGGIERSKRLLGVTAMVGDQQSISSVQKGETPELQQERQEQSFNTAEEALQRISNLSLGSSRDRLRHNIGRIVHTFGRHETDKVLDIDPATGVHRHAVSKKRDGPDTGSSEVQIGVLTARIRTLTQFLEGRGRMDKHNRRSLTLLVHRRQKLLKYLQRQDKGGARWQNLTKTLGLTDGTWRGEITVPRYLADR